MFRFLGRLITSPVKTLLRVWRKLGKKGFPVVFHMTNGTKVRCNLLSLDIIYDEDGQFPVSIEAVSADNGLFGQLQFIDLQYVAAIVTKK